MTTKQNRAKTGGEVGVNGEWYGGGAFIANTENPKKSKQKRVATGRQEVQPYKWEIAPDGRLSLYGMLAGVEIYNRIANTFSFNPELAGVYVESDVIEKRKGRIEKYNFGERWV